MSPTVILPPALSTSPWVRVSDMVRVRVSDMVRVRVRVSDMVRVRVTRMH